MGMSKMDELGPRKDLSDSTLRTAETFPVLTDQQIDAIRPYGCEIELEAGEVLYSRGERNIDFFVILSGRIDVFEIESGGKCRPFHTHTRGSFLGEINLFNSRKALVGTRAATASRLIRVGRLEFRRMLAAEPVLARIILRAVVLRRANFLRLGLAGTTLIGEPSDNETLRLQRFLLANDYPFHLLPPDSRDEEGRPILQALSLSPSDLPAIWDSKGHVFSKPCLTDLAYELGLLEEPAQGQVYDVVVVGAGPSGLAASVYAGSEGLDTFVIESWAPGGQAGTSSQIENYLGFPNGISGWELAGRAQTQAQKFGVQVAVPRTVRRIERAPDGVFKVVMGDERCVPARAVIVASGAKYRKLDLPDYDRFEGRGVQYAATAMEGQLSAGQEVVVVGGGNSAGQAAIFLTQYVSKVHMLVRSKTLSATMSRYLVERITASPHIQVYYETEVTRLSGEKTLETLDWKSASDNKVWSKSIRTLFVMIGAIPNTEWLEGCVDLDSKGFVITGRSSESPYETSTPGIFAIGDVRAGSIKRVASAVGEGSIVVTWVHQYLDQKANPQKKAA
jgi:thioredoxin reductase (NADPH)